MQVRTNERMENVILLICESNISSTFGIFLIVQNTVADRTIILQKKKHVYKTSRMRLRYNMINRANLQVQPLP